MSGDLAMRVRRELLTPPTGAYLNTAAEGLPMAAARDGYQRYLDAKSRGSIGRDTFAEIEHDARVAFAGLWGVPEGDVAFVASTSRGIDAVIKSIEWSAGSSLVLPASEFPTAVGAADLLRAEGVLVRSVPSRPDGSLDERDVVAAIDESTRLVIMSVVSFKTGQHHHTDEIIARAHAVGALVLLDCVQALGQVECAAGEADFACAASFKWLQGVHGAAGFYVNPAALESLRAPYAAYRGVVELFPRPPRGLELHQSARRYEEGMPDFGALAVLVAGLGVSAAWRSEIPAHNGRLVGRLLDGLIALGADVLAPRARRGSIVAFSTPRYADIAAALLAEGTTVWARDGRVRLSPHAYTTAADIESVLVQLARIGVR